MTKRYRTRSRSYVGGLALPRVGTFSVPWDARAISLPKGKKAHAMWLGSFMLLLCLLGSLAWYVTALSATVGEDYTRTKLEDRIKVLQAENQDLQVALSKGETLTKIQERASVLGLIPAGRTVYVALPGGSFAAASSATAIR